MEHFNMHMYGYFIIILVVVRNLTVCVQSVLSNLVCMNKIRINTRNLDMRDRIYIYVRYWNKFKREAKG